MTTPDGELHKYTTVATGWDGTSSAAVKRSDPRFKLYSFLLTSYARVVYGSPRWRTRMKKKETKLPHFGGMGPHRYESPGRGLALRCVYCGKLDPNRPRNPRPATSSPTAR